MTNPLETLSILDDICQQNDHYERCLKPLIKSLESVLAEKHTNHQSQELIDSQLQTIDALKKRLESLSVLIKMMDAG